MSDMVQICSILRCDLLETVIVLPYSKNNPVSPNDLVRQDVNGRAESDFSSPLSRVHLPKVPLAYHAWYSSLL
jgi:hypothetical protein